MSRSWRARVCCAPTARSERGRRRRARRSGRRASRPTPRRSTCARAELVASAGDTAAGSASWRGGSQRGAIGALYERVAARELEALDAQRPAMSDLVDLTMLAEVAAS